MKTILATVTCTLLILAGAALIVVHSGAYDVSAARPHGGLSAWLMHATMEASVERRAGDVQVPDLDDEFFLSAGVNDFDAMCVGCHGAPGQEPGPVGKGLSPEPPDLADSAREMSPAELFWVTKNGIRMTGMPAWSETHSDEELWPVVALMVALPDMDARAYSELKARAEGTGHHDQNGSGQDHSHDSGRNGHDHGQSDGRDAGDSDMPGATEHDHGTHDH